MKKLKVGDHVVSDYGLCGWDDIGDRYGKISLMMGEDKALIMFMSAHSDREKAVMRSFNQLKKITAQEYELAMAHYNALRTLR